MVYSTGIIKEQISENSEEIIIRSERRNILIGMYHADELVLQRREEARNLRAKQKEEKRAKLEAEKAERREERRAQREAQREAQRKIEEEKLKQMESDADRSFSSFTESDSDH